LSIDDNTIFQNSFFDNETCECSNILLEAHYTVFFSDVSETFNVQSKIDNITVDVIYGDYLPESCATNVNFTRKTSMKYKQSIYARKNSGGPGYVKGSKILTGNDI